ncbi:class I adenylate-forming enzyme family protein [Humibacter sp.]|jgi:acyl-CoA synthetase (AMP-forming)/AMP-acid ligase II|uniref:class I adenylate-forming enzyme family protein n=1 Tax=Humibacter sp. TaxID=1940291 RepID=UPI002BA435EF|nr:class I adenylate-forming enzyme family protein [Humibacter sp.]HVX07687.1 class I adenylate-forming enzyme family protein [Humibacter sp.]
MTEDGPAGESTGGNGANSARNTDYDPSEFRRVFENHFTWAAAFERNTHRYAHRPALTDPQSGRRWTYEELGAVTGRLVEGLRSHGVGVGDIVAYQLMNVPEFAFLYIAAQGLRAVSSPMNFRLAPGETAHILNTQTPTVFVYDIDDTANVRQALELAEHAPRILAGVGEGELLPGAIRFEELLADEAPSFHAPADASTWDETSRLYTSGTTGMPKAVPLTSLNEVLTAHDVIMHFPLSPTDKTMNMSPWFHRGGNYCAGPNTAFYVGAEVVTLPKFDPQVVLQSVQDYRLTYVIGAPTNLERLADAQEAQPRDLSSLHGIVTMGAPLDRAAALRYQRVLTPRIANGYGTTEAFWNTYLRPDDLPDAAGAAGRACLDDDVAVVKVHSDRIASPDEHAKKDGQEIGEVIMRSVKSGYAYLGNSKEQAEKFRDGWVYPGDLATWDENEIVTVVGRKDDMIISGGENVHPVQVEEVLAGHEDVADSIVVGLPDQQWGEVVVAYVQPRDGKLTDASSAARELDAFLRASVALADYKRPRRYAFVSELPYTATGKKQHFKLKAQAQQDADENKFVSP